MEKSRLWLAQLSNKPASEQPKVVGVVSEKPKAEKKPKAKPDDEKPKSKPSKPNPKFSVPSDTDWGKANTAANKMFDKLSDKEKGDIHKALEGVKGTGSKMVEAIKTAIPEYMDHDPAMLNVLANRVKTEMSAKEEKKPKSKKTASLRTRLIRLAYQQPNLRKDILPLLR